MGKQILKNAILINGLRWDCQELDSIQISKDISFIRFASSKIESLYNKLCEDRVFHESYTDGFETVVVVGEEKFGESGPYWHTPHSIISEICNLIAICTGFPPLSYSIINSKDNFKTNWGTPLEIHYRYELYETLAYDVTLTPEVEKLLSSINRNFKDDFNLTPLLAEKVKTCFSNQCLMSSGHKRLRNAFDFFFNSWHVDQMEQTCINLAVILETLFSPSENTELNFRIAFNTSNFLGKDKSEKENIFKVIKKFYSLRSKIVHGGKADFEEVYIFSSVVFLLCAETLERIGLDNGLSIQFSNDKKREDLFNGWMFS